MLVKQLNMTTEQSTRHVTPRHLETRSNGVQTVMDLSSFICERFAPGRACRGVMRERKMLLKSYKAKAVNVTRLLDLAWSVGSWQLFGGLPRLYIWVTFHSSRMPKAKG